MEPEKQPSLRLVKAAEPDPRDFQTSYEYQRAFLAARGVHSGPGADGEATDAELVAKLCRESQHRWDRMERAKQWSSHARSVLRTLGGVLLESDVETIVARKWEESEAFRVAREWSEAMRDPTAPRALFLLGRPDTGKTFAAAVWLAVSSQRRDYVPPERSMAYVKERELCRLSLANFDEEAREYRRLLGVERLVLDEIDQQNNEAAARRVLMDVLDERKGAGRMTIVIGNLTPDQLRAWRCDDRIVSRLRAYARIEVIVDKGRRPDLGYL